MGSLQNVKVQMIKRLGEQASEAFISLCQSWLAGELVNTQQCHLLLILQTVCILCSCSANRWVYSFNQKVCCQNHIHVQLVSITLNFKAGTATQEEVCRPWNWSSRSLSLWWYRLNLLVTKLKKQLDQEVTLISKMKTVLHCATLTSRYHAV